MKAIKIFITLLMISLILSACSGPNTSSLEKIVSPENQKIPIKGTWEITKVLTASSEEEDKNQEWLGKEVQFASSHVFLGESVLDRPQYRMKRVNKEDYLMFNSKFLPADLVLPHKEIEIITVIDEDKFFCELVIIKEDELVLKLQGHSFYLSKRSSEVDEYISMEYEVEDNEEVNIKMDKDEEVYTGVLIGLRSPKDEDNTEAGYNYRTLWVSSRKNEVGPILEMENIFFPRRSGFWKIEVGEAQQGERAEEYIQANNVLMEDRKAELHLMNKIMRSEGLPIREEDMEDIVQGVDFSRWENRTGQIKRKINYVGNDYISVETTGKGQYIIGNEDWQKNKLEILPIDGLPNAQAVKMSDILDEAGVSSMKSAWERELGYLNLENNDILYREELIENFGLERKLGHWFFKGRINYMRDKEFRVADYNIRLIPPSKLVSYDTLSVAWPDVKDKVPRAIDVYTSPNKDMALVVTRGEILIYDIIGSGLGPHPKERIGLEKGERIIMAEWATGHYVDSWENTFKNSGGQVLDQ